MRGTYGGPLVRMQDIPAKPEEPGDLCSPAILADLPGSGKKTIIRCALISQDLYSNCSKQIQSKNQVLLGGLMTAEQQQSPIRRWTPVIILVIAIACIGIYFTAGIPPQQPAKLTPPENDAVGVSAATPSHTIEWENSCSYPVWVDVVGGIQWTDPNKTVVGACGKNPQDVCNPNTVCSQVKGCDKGKPLVDGGGFKLEANGGTHSSTVDSYWQGAFWGRTGCTGTDDDLTCDWKTCTGTDGKGKLQCGGSGLSQMTKGEINFDENGGDTYDVSAVDGFNVPMTITPVAGTFTKRGIPDANYDCTSSGTTFDLKDSSVFPATLNKDLIISKNSKPAAVLSACQYSYYKTGVENTLYCCIGEHGKPQTCNPKDWPVDMRTDLFFKKYLPGAYSWAFDDHASTYQCKNKDANTLSSYKVVFCGSPATDGAVAPAGTGQALVTAAGSSPVVSPPVTQTAAPRQTPVPSGTYNPAGSGAINY